MKYQEVKGQSTARGIPHSAKRRTLKITGRINRSERVPNAKYIIGIITELDASRIVLFLMDISARAILSDAMMEMSAESIDISSQWKAVRIIDGRKVKGRNHPLTHRETLKMIYWTAVIETAVMAAPDQGLMKNWTRKPET